MLVGSLVAGNCFGHRSAVYGVPESMTVVARQGSILWKLSKDDLDIALKQTDCDRVTDRANSTSSNADLEQTVSDCVSSIQRRQVLDRRKTHQERAMLRDFISNHPYLAHLEDREEAIDMFFPLVFKAGEVILSQVLSFFLFV